MLDTKTERKADRKGKKSWRKTENLVDKQIENILQK